MKMKIKKNSSSFLFFEVIKRKDIVHVLEKHVIQAPKKTEKHVISTIYT